MAMIDIDWNPPPRGLRQFGRLLIVFSAVVAAVVFFKSGRVPWAVGLFAVGTLIGLIGVCFPRAIRPIYVAWMAAVLPIGWVVSHLLLAAVFYLIVTPIGIMMRWCGYDPAKRKFDKEAETYWQHCPPHDDQERYFRQY